MDNWTSFNCYWCSKGYLYNQQSLEKKSAYKFSLDGYTHVACGDCCIKQGFTGFKPNKPEENTNIPEDERIYVSQKDYKRLNFCRKNWLCKLMYRVLG